MAQAHDLPKAGSAGDDALNAHRAAKLKFRLVDAFYRHALVVEARIAEHPAFRGPHGRRAAVIAAERRGRGDDHLAVVDDKIDAGVVGKPLRLLHRPPDEGDIA